MISPDDEIAEFVSLFPVGISTILTDHVRRTLAYVEDDSPKSSAVLLAPSPRQIKALLSLSDLRYIDGDSKFTEEASQILKISVSGYSNRVKGEKLLTALLETPVRLPLQVSHLHVHLSTPSPDNSSSTEHPTQLYSLLKPRAGLSDLVLPVELRTRLHRNLLVLKHRSLLTGWGFDDIPGFDGRIGVSLNFIGPSGTGKSLAARAVAHELDKPLVEVDYAGLESKYVGDTSKHIREVFDAARESDAVLFFDEADSFLGRRIEDVGQSYDTAVNSTRAVMLMELQQFDGIVLFATNLASNYDSAFRRRILDHVPFPLPDTASRLAILEMHTPKRVPGRSGIDYGHLAVLSDGLSGGDLSSAVFRACLRVLERLDAGVTDAALTTADLKAAVDEAHQGRELIPDVRPTLSVARVSEPGALAEVSPQEGEAPTIESDDNPDGSKAKPS
ncbi:ATP-binding protein [Acrocarpospora sp. B8E8]|uniref:ATP-binding protein n=1 Tax=Acrocarpospora sp. B8E8 TaxID=3153572 RepID=UPI00325F7EEF